MAYKITEQNQILVALFAIVVLCAGKLFKDYLYRGGYIEGLTVTPVSDTVLRRPKTKATLYLYLTLGAQLSAGNNVTVSWPTDKGVTMGANTSDYTFTVTGGSFNTPPSITTANNVTTLTSTLASGSVLNSGSKIKISMADVSITDGSANIVDFIFTTRAGTEAPVSTQIKILASAGEQSFTESTSAQEIRDAINTINTRITNNPMDGELQRIRSALVNVLAYTYGTVKEAGKVFDSDALYEAQKTAIDFIAKEKARAASNAKDLSQDNLNKRRMAQINTYYTRNYEANTEVMKNIIYASVALIVLAVLRNKELIPASISTLGIIFILTMSGIVIGKQVFDIMRRNDHDFDKYDWTFNEDDMNNKFVQPTADTNKFMDLGLGSAPCYGPGCCDVGTTWDPARSLCAPSAGALSSQGSSAVWTASTLTITMKISQALANGHSININLPSGVFTPATSGGTASFASSAIANGSVTKTGSQLASEISLPVISTGVAVSAPVVVTITGIIVSPNADLTSFQNVRVSTSLETTPVILRITGLPRA
jgi:hypothetical protein